MLNREKPLLSIVIPTTGSTPTLSRTVSALCECTRSYSSEIIIVQNGAGSPLCEKLTSSLTTPVSVIYDTTAGLLAGRHRGLAEASGKIIVFIDDDIEVRSGWIPGILGAFRDPEVVLVGGPSRPEFEFDPPEWLDEFWHVTPDGIRSCGYLSLLDAGEARRDIPATFVWGLNFSIRKDALEMAGGFHPDGVPWELRRFRGDGETGLALKLQAKGARAVYDPAAEVTHIVPKERMTVEYFEKRAYLQGISDSYSQIRAVGGLRSDSHARTWRCVLGAVKRRLLNKWKQVSATESRSLTHSLEKERVVRAYHEGFDYHQNEVSRDPVLLAWVLKKNYWDYSYPENV
jgi:glycosyltransferase involved in cell wall biosynthesis